MTFVKTFLTGNKRSLKFILGIVIAISLAACSEDDDDDMTPATEDIVATAQGNSNLSTLVTAL